MTQARPPTDQVLAWRLRVFAGFCLLCVVGVGLLASQIWPQATGGGLAELLSTVEAAGHVGWIVFLALQIIVVISGVLPASTIGVAAGAAYGLRSGFLLATTAVIIGALVSFALARSLLRPFIARMLQRRARLRRFDELVARDGWKFVCLLRASPIMPFAATSYGLGLSSISLGQYLIGTLASLPALLAYVFVGTLTRAGLSAWSGGAAPFRLVLIAVGIIATLLLTVYVGRYVARSGLAAEQLIADGQPKTTSPAQGGNS